MELSAIERSVLAELTSDLRSDFGAVDVRLFGSAARGELGSESDIDLFVTVPDLSWPIERSIWDRCYEATLACGRVVTATLFAAHDLTNTPLSASPLVLTVQRDGVPL